MANVTDEMKALDNKVNLMLRAGKKNREICGELGITYVQLTSSLRRLGIYKRSDSKQAELNVELGAETVTVQKLMDEKLNLTNEKAKVKVYIDKREGKRYSDVSEFYGL